MIKKNLKSMGSLTILTALFLSTTSLSLASTPQPATKNFDEEFCHNFNCEFDIDSEIKEMLEEISEGETFVNALENLAIKDEIIKASINRMKELIKQVRSTLTSMQEHLSNATEDPGKNTQKFWDILDEIELAARIPMDKIVEYLNGHPEMISNLEANIPKEMETIMEWYMNRPDNNSKSGFKDGSISPEFEPGNFSQEAGPYYHDRYRTSFMDQYADVTDNSEEFYEQLRHRIESDVMKKVMRTVNDNLMKELAKHFGDEEAGRMLGNIMNGMEVFGEEFGSRMLERQTETLEIFADFQPDVIPYSRAKIIELSDRARNTVVPEKYSQKLAETWSKIEELTKNNEDNQNNKLIDQLLIDLKTLLDSIDNENIFGENPIEFRDVRFDEQPWYWEPVMSARKRGIINGYRDEDGLTGYFGPADDVTYAQALKMIMKAAGHHVSESKTDRLWYQGYLEALDQLKLTKLTSQRFKNWDTPATRGEILLMINQVFAIQPTDYIDGTFSDVKITDTIANDAMASYLAGIFTGEGKTGKLNPQGRINRAGFAKVIHTAIRYYENNNLVERLKDFEANFEFNNKLNAPEFESEFSEDRPFVPDI